MLVLTRRVGERIHIGDDVIVTVTAIDNNRVKLGIEAPRPTPIWREELHRPREVDRPECSFLLQR